MRGLNPTISNWPSFLRPPVESDFGLGLRCCTLPRFRGLMSAQVVTVELPQTPVPQWCATQRVAFRFCFLYFGLYCFYTQIITALISIPNMEIGDPSAHWPMRQIVFWIASHVFHAKLPLVYTGSGSGDKTFDWVLTFFLLIFSVVATVLWSVSRSAPEKLCDPLQVVPAFSALRAGLTAHWVWARQGCSVADAVSLPAQIA